MFGLGMGELAMIFAVALIFLGPERLPTLGNALGKTFVGFKKGAVEAKRDIAMLEADIKEIAKAAQKEV